MYKEGPLNYLRADSTNYTIRSVIDGEGNPWLLAMDVAALFDMPTAKVIRHTSPTQRIQFDMRFMDEKTMDRLTEDAPNNIPTRDLIRTRARGNLSRVWLITPKGLSHIIRKSRHPLAERINDWMYDEVLPSLIMHGKYVVDENEFNALKDMVVALQEQIEIVQSENKVLWSHTDLRLRDLSKEGPA